MPAYTMKVRELMTTDVATIGRNDELTIGDDIMKMKRPLSSRRGGRPSRRNVDPEGFIPAALSTALNFGEKAQKEF
jgi:hypothetical protein